MSANLFLEDIMVLLSHYGRPTMNQHATSASPGFRSAGQWNVEVWIPAKEYKEMTPEQHALSDKLSVRTGARMIGRSMNPTEAARECLRKCEELAESPAAPLLRFVNTDACKAAEKLRRTDAEMEHFAKQRAAAHQLEDDDIINPGKGEPR